MAQTLTIIRGDTIDDVIQLRLNNKSTSVSNSFIIETASLVEITFPGTAATLTLSTANVGEIAIVDANKSTISFSMSPTQSGLLALGKGLSIDVIVTQGISGKVLSTTMTKVLTVVDRANL